MSAGFLFLIVQLVFALDLWTIDWNFASNRVVLALPAVEIPAIAVGALTIPRLWHLARGRSTPLHREAASPHLVVPVQLAGLGAFVDFWVVFIDRPAPPYLSYATLIWIALGGGAVLLWRRQAGRQRGLNTAAPLGRTALWRRSARAAVGIGAVAIAVVGLIGYGTLTSRLPDRLGMASATMDWGGGPVGAAHHPTHHVLAASHGDVAVPTLTGHTAGTPDVRFTLVAQEQRLRLSSGRAVEAWTFNGQAPGPELRMHQGDLVEVTVVNHLRSEGVTVHWHGLDVPNAEDGVAGVTQDAIQPGHRFVYRFRADQVGTFWYHSHQASAPAVARGLFGPLVVLPRTAPSTNVLDIPVVAHTWQTSQGNVEALGTSDTPQRRTVTAGTHVRLRLINTSDNLTSDVQPRILSVSGARVRVTAIDGTNLHGPTELATVRLAMAVGGRYDVELTMPDHPVRLTDELAPTAGLVLSPSGTGNARPVRLDGPVFDPAAYGASAATPFDAQSKFDRSFRLILDDGPGFYDGHFTFPPTINGKVFPDTPMLMVREGDLVKTTIINRGHLDHPMHLHGHHVLVLTRNGIPTTGSPWWSDTLEVEPGEVYEVAFRADNPGVWMDHCHNLDHAAHGMVMHLAYAGVSSPYEVGHATTNRPE
ncbi:multicopper oxidase family protein [Tenggerimyces flavus]|uniref:Copper-containing nitrite reductase n=1 Tax=Tenggerimyces flavus TaxID=1708749 RepID=A0ABV7YNG6_9ACTN|nr:multicopper oxidase family protein [Tenggerimyces flavus]MBM7790256.1 FtsP/CotA-like multicopper oxidase with cupredoxin domain [Tenggerimyces flavus]